jgi:CHAT domain-containing protein
LYPNSELLLDTDATKAPFLDAARAHDVVHFAGHGVSNDDYPGLSRLLFAGAGESSRSLFAHEIAKMHFDRTQLVVLAACRTGAGRIRRGEGVFSLARPFIAAGVPTVVASLWDVDDRASRALLVAFHRALRRGASVVDALRSAQLAALADSDPVLRAPANWASFAVEDDGRRAVPGAPQIQSVPSDVDEMSGRRSRRELLSSRKPLVLGTCERSNADHATQTDENA